VSPLGLIYGWLSQNRLGSRNETLAHRQSEQIDEMTKHKMCVNSTYRSRKLCDIELDG
jgi:hypothetical protein